MTLPLLVVIPLSAADLALAHSLLKHLAWLGPVHHHSVLFVADQQLTDEQWTPLLDVAKPIFPGGGQLMRTPLANLPAYPQAHNLRFETAAKHIATHQRAPWLFLSPRCVPMRRGWLLELEGQYAAHSTGQHAKPIMGQVLTPEHHKVAQPLVPATAIYPAELPKRALQRLVAQRDRDFELTCADLFVPLTHPTTLIVNHPLNGSDGVPIVPALASLVFTAKARELGAKVRGESTESRGTQIAAVARSEANQLTAEKRQELLTQGIAAIQAASAALEKPNKLLVINPEEPGVIREVIDQGQKVENVVATLQPRQEWNTRTSYYHSGNLGDVIYALAAVKLAGGGRLILGPQARKTPPCSSPIKEEAFERFAPLLDAQPYLGPSKFSARHPGTDTAIDLNHFRANWNDSSMRARTGITNLARMHAYTLQCDEKFHPSQTWLSCDAITTPYYVVHRSSRYRAEGEKAFPWALVIKHFKGRLLFVGLASEHADFQRTFSLKVPFFQCVNFLEMARIIAGSLGFIGNQSLPCALALGLGVRVLQESWPECPDCTFARPNFLVQPFTEAQLDKWEEPLKKKAGMNPPA